MESLFYDTPQGMAPNKNQNFQKSYPVIVMEILSGGELPYRIKKRVEANEEISEHKLSLIFREIILALESIHNRNYIHRDLKLENLLFSNERDDSPIKIIDFGCMIQLAKNEIRTVRAERVGTRGCFAPETLTHREYSYKTDIWQAGCILYW